MTIDDILQSILPRLTGTKPGCSIFDAVRGVQSIIVNRLLLLRSNLIEQPLELPVYIGESSVTLPLGYASMAQRPYLMDTPGFMQGRVLTPLNGPATADLLSPGEPRYYDVIGRSLSLFPPPAADIVVNLRAFVRPGVPTELDSEIPFQGNFDEVYAFGAHAVLLQGPGVISDRAFTALIESQVEGVLLARNLSDEQMLADSINFP